MFAVNFSRRFQWSTAKYQEKQKELLKTLQQFIIFLKFKIPVTVKIQIMSQFKSYSKDCYCVKSAHRYRVIKFLYKLVCSAEAQ